MKPVKVFFNASVILAALNSPGGGSAKLIKYCRQQKIYGEISEIVLDEVRRNLFKFKTTAVKARQAVLVFAKILPPPEEKLVKKYQRMVIDPGDGHIFASADEAKAKYLVSLDKHHILVLSKKITKFKIVNPKELIEKLNK